MAQVDPNADIYASKRLNKFFTGVVPSLDGQCVSLVKWFMQEMSGVPNPQAARGDARYMGQTLVSQGHATEVAYANRRRGDIVCYEFGTYGHIGIQLSGGRVFEENVNMGGVASKIVDGAYVYASRIGSETESWRVGKNPHIYRLKTYTEGGTMDAEYKALLKATQGIADVMGIAHDADHVDLQAMLAWAQKKAGQNFDGLLKSIQGVADELGIAHDATHVDVTAILEAVKTLKANSGTGDSKLIALGQALKEFVKE